MIPDQTLVSRAIVVWTGWGDTTSPVRDETRLVEQFGSEITVELLPQIREVESRFYSSNARLTTSDVTEMGEVAAEDFRGNNPGFSEEAVQALTWCYTFDFK
jgi:hypothetical protein